jgi:hypothetical protein
MPLEFFFLDYSDLQTLVIRVFIISTYIILVLGTISLKKLKKEGREFQYVNLFMGMSILILAMSIMHIIIPSSRWVESGTFTYPEDVQIGFFYDLTRGKTIELGLLILLGISLIIFGRQNRNQLEGSYGNYLMGAGGIMVFASSLSLFNNTIRFLLAWFRNPNLNTNDIHYGLLEADIYQTNYYYILEWVFYWGLAVFALIILYYGIKTKEKYFALFSALFLILQVYTIIEFNGTYGFLIF